MNSKRILIVFLILATVLSGCKNEIIPSKDMVVILAEVFVTDAVVATSKNSFKFSKRDTIEYYAPIYNKMGYTEQQFVATMNYYFDNPKEFDSVLDKVVNYLSVMETELDASIPKVREKQMSLVEDSTNLWKEKATWIFPADADQDSLYFKIPVKKLGTYTLSALVKILPNDESIEPKTLLWLTRDSTGIRDSLKMAPHIWSHITNDIALSFCVTDSTYTHIEGFVLGHLPQYGEWKKFAEVSDIKITYSPLVIESKQNIRSFTFQDSSRIEGRAVEMINSR